MRSLANASPCTSGDPAASESHRSSPRLPTISITTFSMCGPCSSIPVDLRGLPPRIAADQTEWVPPKFLPTTGKGILFLDELTSAPQMTQAGCYQLVLDRKLGEYTLPDDWVVIAAGNPASERVGRRSLRNAETIAQSFLCT